MRIFFPLTLSISPIERSTISQIAKIVFFSRLIDLPVDSFSHGRVNCKVIYNVFWVPSSKIMFSFCLIHFIGNMDGLIRGFWVHKKSRRSNMFFTAAFYAVVQLPNGIEKVCLKWGI